MPGGVAPLPHLLHDPALGCVSLNTLTFSFDGNAHIFSLLPSSYTEMKARAYVWRFHERNIADDSPTKL